mgnify:CR=1 FL=1
MIINMIEQLSNQKSIVNLLGSKGNLALDSNSDGVVDNLHPSELGYTMYAKELQTVLC